MPKKKNERCQNNCEKYGHLISPWYWNLIIQVFLKQIIAKILWLKLQKSSTWFRETKVLISKCCRLQPLWLLGGTLMSLRSLTMTHCRGRVFSLVLDILTSICGGTAFVVHQKVSWLLCTRMTICGGMLRCCFDFVFSSPEIADEDSGTSTWFVLVVRKLILPMSMRLQRGMLVPPGRNWYIA